VVVVDVGVLGVVIVDRDAVVGVGVAVDDRDAGVDMGIAFVFSGSMGTDDEVDIGVVVDTIFICRAGRFPYTSSGNTCYFRHGCFGGCRCRCCCCCCCCCC
jgi:hypothetical protein